VKRLALILVLASVLAASVGIAHGAMLPLNHIQQGSAYFSPVLGLCEDYPRGTFAEDIERDFAMMAEYGITDLRVSIAWGDFEFAKGFTEWWLMDDTVDLAEKYGITLYPYICYAPTWATRAAWKSPPEDLQDWYDFVYEAVDRYKGRIHVWELWNEGDNEDFWVGTWEEQLELVKVGAQAVKDADPTAKTVFGGLTKKNPPHVETIFTSGVADYLDVINIHFYNETWDSTPTERIYETVKGVADVIRRYGGRQELWVAEIGYSDYVEPDGRVSYWVRTRAPYEKTRHFQAVTFARSYARMAATEDISTILWYEVKNLRSNSAAIGDVNNYHLGALDEDYFPKHLWFAVAAFNKLFAESFTVIDSQLVVDKENAIYPYVHAFQRQNGDVIVLAWNRGTAVESIGVTVPGSFADALQHTVTGNKTSFSFTAEGNDTTLALELRPEDISIIELFASSAPARLALADWNAEKLGNGAYRINATVVNRGSAGADGVLVEIIPNPNVTIISGAEPQAFDLAPGEAVSVSWEVEAARPGQLWVVARHRDAGPAAELLQL
jgi:hypothetical protein